MPHPSCFFSPDQLETLMDGRLTYTLSYPRTYSSGLKKLRMRGNETVSIYPGNPQERSM